MPTPNPNPTDAIIPQSAFNTTDGGAAAQRMAEQAWAPGQRDARRTPTDAPGLQPMQIANFQTEIQTIRSESVPNSTREIARQGGKAQLGDERQQQIFQALRDKVLDAPGPGGAPSLASQGWEIYQSAKDSPADKAHMDFVLMNRKTGQYYFLDSTAKDKNTGDLWRRGIIKYSGSDFDGGAATDAYLDKLGKQLRDLTSKQSPLNLNDFPPPSLKKLDTDQATMQSLEDFQARLRSSGNPEMRRYAQDIQRSTDHTNTAARVEATPQSKQDAFNAQAQQARTEVMRELLSALATSKEPLTERNHRAGGFEIRGNDIIYKNGSDTFKLPVTRTEVEKWYQEARTAELSVNSDKLNDSQQKLKKARAANSPDEKIKQDIKRLEQRDDQLVALRQVRLSDDDIKKIAERIVTKLSAKTPEQLMGMEVGPLAAAAAAKPDAPPATPPRDTAGEKIAGELRAQNMRTGEEPAVLALAVDQALRQAQNLSAAERKDLEALRDGLEKGDVKSVDRVTKLLQPAPDTADAAAQTNLLQALDPQRVTFLNGKGEVMRLAVLEFLKNGLDEKSPLNAADKEKLAKLLDDYRANKPDAVRSVHEMLGIKPGGSAAADRNSPADKRAGSVEQADRSLSPDQRAADTRYLVACREIGREGLVRQLLEVRNIPSREARELEERLLSDNKEIREEARKQLERRIGRDGVEGLQRDILAEARKPGGGRFCEMSGRLGSVAVVVGTLIQVFGAEAEASTRTPEATWGAGGS